MYPNSDFHFWFFWESLSYPQESVQTMPIKKPGIDLETWCGETVEVCHKLGQQCKDERTFVSLLDLTVQIITLTSSPSPEAHLVSIFWECLKVYLPSSSSLSFSWFRFPFPSSPSYGSANNCICSYKNCIHLSMGVLSFFFYYYYYFFVAGDKQNKHPLLSVLPDAMSGLFGRRVQQILEPQGTWRLIPLL